jgi:mannose-6-phosphate isomerase-like protein (cupin superfamily)
MVAVRNWRTIVPNIAHETAIVWPYFHMVGLREDAPKDVAVLQGFQALTVHQIQPGKSGDNHVHFDREQVYYFTRGSGKLNIDEVIYPVKKGDAVCIPTTCYHQMINDTDEWLEHLIINGLPQPQAQQDKNKEAIAANGAHGSKLPIAHRSWLDSQPHISHGAALLWSIFAPKGAAGKSFNEAPVEGIKKLTIHRLQPSLETGVHAHDNMEQVYFFTQGRGKMIVGDETIDVRDGDAVYGPPKVPHGLINDSDDWVEHLIMSANVP